eukprot:gnl/MRDRNA2_/MRDRNA2_29053_c0_seq1.p1 gnl/MRDRNA2_/MRDRNA2_29053_c0~~gnl/MRDRNA2_/MRDRNA2_29053_c0_seq1.p1  ORF type:complete len:386 (+),score=76.56 gnl/MRDRNA2_/MRDRNA2_29053_c0_seq1:41-1159(+)
MFSIASSRQCGVPVTRCLRQISTNRPTLPRRALGRTGLQVTFPALGGVGLGGVSKTDLYGGVSEQQGVDAVLTAVRRGINFIDTAPLYMESERRIGIALGELNEEEKADLIISTKVGDECPPYSNNGGYDALSAAGVRCSIENSLRMLGLNCIDVLILHDTNASELEAFLAAGGGMEGLRQAKREGLVKHLGLGTHDKPHAPLHRRFLQEHDGEILLTVNDWNLLRRYGGEPYGCVTAAVEANAGVMNAGVFYMGLLSGLPPSESFSYGFKGNLKPQMYKTITLAERQWQWCKARKVSLGSFALQWAMKHDGISTCIIGCRTSEEVDGVCDMAEVEVSEELWQEFESEFEKDIAALAEADHWWYVKGESVIN